MAAMAPALTDAPADAHRIRFKLAPPSSTLSPSGGDNGGGTGHILVSSNGAVKRKVPDERGPHGGTILTGKGLEESPRDSQAPPGPLGKLQPLVASYLCSDVTSVPSTKESLKLQGVLLQKHGILPNFLPRKHQTLELSEEQLKCIMNNGRGVGSTALAPVNGVAKKLAKNGPDRNNFTEVNGGNNRPPAGCGLDLPLPQMSSLRGNSPLNGGGESQPPAGVSQTPEQPSAHSAITPTDCPDSKSFDRPPSLSTGTLSPSPSDRQTSLGQSVLGEEVKGRIQQMKTRQGEVEGRLWRLKKRLQVVQAKQVERHVRQQLGGLLECTLGPLNALRPGNNTPLTPHERERLGRFLKDGSVPAELERLSLSGTSNLLAAESAFDSDATESSSGGETDVEDEITRVDVDQRHISLWRRAEGRYAVERASIISHWNWLQAHVSDLEYRIRQQTDIYRQLRSNKESGSDGGAEGSGWVAAETGLRKGCPSGRQVNGVINSLRSGSPECSELDEQLRKQLPPSSQLHRPLQDDTCTAARSRPLLGCKRRRLVRPSAVSNINRKVLRICTPAARCEVNPQCMTCGGRAPPTTEPQYDRPLLERLSQFDPCIHPILSLTDDVATCLRLQRVLKSHWNSRPLEKAKAQKKPSLKHKLSLGRQQHPPSSFSKDKHMMTNSLPSSLCVPHQKLRSEKMRSEKLCSEKPHRQHLDSLLGSTKLEGRPYYRGERGHEPFDSNKSHARRRPREPSLSLDRVNNTPRLYLDSGSPCPSAGLHTPTQSPLFRQLSAFSETSSMAFTPFNSSTSQPIRRRRGESSFDINNIVIPMSVAATTRVEKLQYKEILTPSWREVDICAKPIAEEDDALEVEDLSDTAFSQHHQPCEDQERSRWSWTAIAKRRGSRSYVSGRLDGRSTPLLGGTNPSTPQPSSPDATHFQALQDYGSAASPCSPASPDLLPNPYTLGPRDSQRQLSNEDTRCSTPEGTSEELVVVPVHPWERRTFPLETDPPPEPEEQPGSAEERPYRTLRRISGCKTGSSKSESDTGGPPSPLPPPDDSTKQKAPSTLTRPSHR